jgi:hypothetical protein
MAHVMVLAGFPSVVPRGRAIGRLLVAHLAEGAAPWGP